MKVKVLAYRWLYGIQAWEHCECESCKINIQRKKDNSLVGLIPYIVQELWESRIVWFLIGGTIAMLFKPEGFLILR